MKKTLMIMLALVLVIAMSVTGTLAYLTSTPDAVVNTFTVGKLAIELDEAEVDQYGENENGRTEDGNEYKLVPGHTYIKDPTVWVQPDSEKSYLFVKVVNGLEAYEAESTTNTIAAQIASNGWTALEGEDNVFYKVVDPVAAGASAKDYVIFENFTLKEDADFSSFDTAEELETLEVTITAYAVQHDGLSLEAAWAAAQEAAEEQA